MPFYENASMDIEMYQVYNTGSVVDKRTMIQSQKQEEKGSFVGSQCFSLPMMNEDRILVASASVLFH